MPDLSVIIVNWNTRDLLRDCLASVFSKPVDLDFEVFVVDNDSSDGSPEMVQGDFPKARLIRSGGNIGFARANNLAISQSDAPNILLLNSDTVIQPQVMAETLALLRGDPGIGTLGCKLVGLDGTPQDSFCFDYPSGPRVGGPDDILPGGLIECAQVWGAYQLVKREVIDQVGMLDEDFFMFYEDVDWCWRIHDAGWKIAYDPNHSITHVMRASCKKAPSGDHHRRMVISEGLLYWKHHQNGDFSAWRRRRMIHYGVCMSEYWLATRLVGSEKLRAKLEKHIACFQATRALKSPEGCVFVPPAPTAVEGQILT